LAPNSSNLYIVKVAGESMIDVNIYNGDLLIVDKNEKPKDGKIIIAVINGELLVKILKIIDEKVFLFSANSKFLPLEILPNFNFQIQGVVKHVIHEV
jgi:DNA polymerase V